MLLEMRVTPGEVTHGNKADYDGTPAKSDDVFALRPLELQRNLNNKAIRVLRGKSEQILYLTAVLASKCNFKMKLHKR